MKTQCTKRQRDESHESASLILVESLPRDNKRQCTDTNKSSQIPIKLIPEDLLVNVVARVSSESYIDHHNMKVSCRDFFHASKDNYMWQQVSLEKFPLIPWSLKEAFDYFMQSCKEGENIEALFRVGLQELKSSVGNIEKGMKDLKMAAEKKVLPGSKIHICFNFIMLRR
ncbi:hypothetical protein VNO80_21924 [Phaseolus coccineus]|uniref:At2g35280-like TPR domain-containing protein n=1 Tax=Phaseolus coccineus TaxID=3886 RepID=A0AAN9M715_PHACN